MKEICDRKPIMAPKKKTLKKHPASTEKPEKVFSQDALFLAVVLALAAGFRLFLSRYQFAVANDEVNYLKLAATAAEGGITGALHPFWAPFYPLATALFSKVGIWLFIISIKISQASSCCGPLLVRA